MKINYLKHKNIDYDKWDACIEKSGNSLIYAYSWYLDVVSPGWEALIGGNYEYVMPLPVKKKFGIKYLVQPLLTQQLGVFSELPINEDIVNAFIRKIPYLSYSLNLNEGNSSLMTMRQPNYKLNLNQSKNILTENFSKNTKRNIQKSQKYSLIIDEKVEIDEFISFYENEEVDYPKIDVTFVGKLVELLASKQALKILGCRDSNNNLVAVVCLIYWKNRIINLLPVSSKEGKGKRAMFWIIDSIIEQYAEREFILDFEGSKVEGVARFYKGFGAKNQFYYSIERCRPQRLINLINKR